MAPPSRTTSCIFPGIKIELQRSAVYRRNDLFSDTRFSSKIAEEQIRVGPQSTTIDPLYLFDKVIALLQSHYLTIVMVLLFDIV